MNKQLFAFLSMIGVGLAIWTVVQGIQATFTAFAASWTPQATNSVASSIASLVWLGGVVFVLVCGYGAFVLFNRWAKVSGRNGGQSQGQHNGYDVVDGDQWTQLPDSYQQPQQRMIEARPASYSWHDTQAFHDRNVAH